MVRSIRAGSIHFRFRLAAIELADDVGANAPERLLVGLRFLAFAVSAFVRCADETALDEHVRPFFDRRCDVFGQPRAENANAMPLGFRGPFVVCVFPRPLCGDGKNGELRTVVVPRLTLFRVCADKPDDRYLVEVRHFLNLLFLAPFSWGTQKREAAAPKARGCFVGGPCDVREEPGKQKPRSCRAQELARSCAQENVRQKKDG